MIRQANRQKTIDRVYADAVIRELRNKLHIESAAAERMFLKYYRAMKRTWGFELNSDAFADKMIELHNIFQVRDGASVPVQLGVGSRVSNLKKKSRLVRPRE